MAIQVKPSEEFVEKYGYGPLENNENVMWSFAMDAMTVFKFRGPYLVAANEARLSFRRNKRAGFGQILILNKED